MWKTVLALLVTIILLPFLSFYLDEPLNETQMAVLRTLVTIYLFAAAACFVLSSLSNNYSQVDKLWSLIPLVYVWVVAWNAGFEPRIVLMAILVTAWGLRLTYNFSRRGGYSWRIWSGEEDYRWSILRSRSLDRAADLLKQR